MNRYSSICRVCGDRARGNNFQVKTCMSCKSFFRRNALLRWGILSCQETNNCIITQKTRTRCPACRLKKCFACGMHPQLIREVNHCQINLQQILTTNQNWLVLPRPQPINLLQNDCSTLTVDQWAILSNVIHAYDEENPVAQMKYVFERQASLPVKLRFKQEDTLKITSAFIQCVQPIVERLSHYQSLPIDIRQILIRKNLVRIGIIHGFFVVNEINAIRDPVYLATCNELYGPAYMTEVFSIINRLESNKTLVKLLISILIFSSNLSIVTFTDEEDIINPTDLIKIQDIYVTVLWKYMIYQYGYIEAIQRFDGMIKTILDIYQARKNLIKIKIHDQMFYKIVKEMEH